MSTKPTIQIGDVAREMNDAEFAQWQTDAANAATQAAENAAEHDRRISARISAMAKLAALGLNGDEISAIVRG